MDSSSQLLSIPFTIEFTDKGMRYVCKASNGGMKPCNKKYTNMCSMGRHFENEHITFAAGGEIK